MSDRAMSQRAGGHGMFLAIAPLIFAVSWSTGNIFAKLGMPYIEPLTFLALRFSFATLLLVGLSWIARAPWPSSFGEAGHIVVAGFLFHGGYLWSVFIAVDEGVSTGTLALIAGMQPLLTALLVGRALGERVGVRQWAGLVLGFIGVGLVVWRKVEIAEGTNLGMLLGMTAMVSLTAGAIYQKKFCANMDLRTGTALQQAMNALATLGLVLLLETREIEWTGELAFSIAWLVVVLTVGSYNLLYYLLRRGQASRVASLFFLTPPVTAVMGYFMFGETLGGLALAGMAVAVMGFALASR